MSNPSSILNVADSGTHSPLRIQLQTEYPKTDTVHDVVAIVIAIPATGWPRNPAIDNVTSTASELSSHKQPSSLTDSTRDVLWQPLVVTRKSPRASMGIGFWKSSIVKPRSLTSMLIGELPLLQAVVLVRCIEADGEKAAVGLEWSDASRKTDNAMAATLRQRLIILFGVY